MKPNTLARHVIKELKKLGFIIQKYESYTTNSIYLKFDYGMAHSLRISDHDGKKHLSYRFNLLSHIDKSRVDRSGPFVRYYYTFADVDKLLQQIIEHRQNLMLDYGNMYPTMMRMNKAQNMSNEGFWKQAVLV